MKIVLDTNVLISALIFGGKPRTIFEFIVVDKVLIGVISKALLDEFIGVLRKKFEYSDIQIAKVENLILENFRIISQDRIPNIVKDDPFDNQILAIVSKHPIDYIISGDNHLLKIKVYHKVPIITPHFFIDKIL